MQNHPQLEAPRLNGVVGTELLFPLMLKMSRGLGSQPGQIPHSQSGWAGCG